MDNNCSGAVRQSLPIGSYQQFTGMANHREKLRIGADLVFGISKMDQILHVSRHTIDGLWQQQKPRASAGCLIP